MAVSLASELRDGRNDAGQVGQQAAGHGVAGARDAHGAEVNGQSIERGVGAALEETAQPAHEGVGPEGRHGIDHHAARPAAAERLHQSRGHGIDPVGGQTRQDYDVADALDEPVHGAAGAEHGDAHQNGNEIRNDAHGRLETFLGAFHKRVIDVLSLAHAGTDEPDYDKEQYHIGRGGAHHVHCFLVHLGKSPHDGGHKQAGAAEEENERGLQEIDALVEARHDNTGQRGDERGQQYGYEHVGGLGGAELGAEHQDGNRDDGQA